MFILLLISHIYLIRGLVKLVKTLFLHIKGRGSSPLPSNRIKIQKKFKEVQILYPLKS